MIKLEKSAYPSAAIRSLLPETAQNPDCENFSLTGRNRTLLSGTPATTEGALRFQSAAPGCDLLDRRGRFSDAERDNILCLLASPDGRFGSLRINPSVQIYTCQLGKGHQITYPINDAHDMWLRCEHGMLALNGNDMAKGNSAIIAGENELIITALSNSEFLLLALW